MRASLTVITPTIPGREQLLARTIASVFDQTLEVEAHLVMAQSITEGLPQPLHCSMQANWLLPSVRSEWVMRLADDDILLPHYVETHREAMASGECDVIYSWDAHKNRPRESVNGWSPKRVEDELMKHNWIEGSAVAIRTSLLRQVGGWPENWVTDQDPHGFGGYFADMFPVCCDDWGVNVRLARGGGRFHCIERETWAFGSGEEGYHQ